MPSAALPGTDNLVVLAARVVDDYLGDAGQREELPTGHLSEYAHPPEEVWPWVRQMGMPHSALSYWQSTGSYEPFHDPLPRWTRNR